MKHSFRDLIQHYTKVDPLLFAALIRIDDNLKLLNGEIQALESRIALLEESTQRVRVTRDAVQSIANGAAYVAIQFNVTRWDNDVMHDNVVNNTRLLINTPGYYIIGGYLEYVGAGGAHSYFVKIQHTNALTGTVSTIDHSSCRVVGAIIPVLSLATCWFCNRGDFVELLTRHTEPAARDVVITDESPSFWAINAARVFNPGEIALRTDISPVLP